MRYAVPLNTCDSKIKTTDMATSSDERDTSVTEPPDALPALPAELPGHPDSAREFETHHYSGRYQWPVQKTLSDEVSASYAELAVDAGYGNDGRMATWQYRAGWLEHPGSTADERAESSAPIFLYRHERAWVAIEDSAMHPVPPEAHAFARESFVDELAHELQRDPVAMRLEHLDARRDAGAHEVIRMVAERSAWGRPQAESKPLGPVSPWARGRGFAFNGEPGVNMLPAPAKQQVSGAVRESEGIAGIEANAWNAWVVDLEINRKTGDVAIRRVVAGRGTGNPDETASGLPSWQIAGAIERATGTRVLTRPEHDETGSSNNAAAVSHALSEWHDDQTPALTALELADVERAVAPAAAAIANALFDATGVRFRSPPFDRESIRRALADAAPVDRANVPFERRRSSRWRRWIAGGGIGGVIGGLIGVAAAMAPGPAQIAPISGVDTSIWSTVTLDRGRQLAAAGDCAVCHTAPGGRTNAGGLALETPFGTVYSTNITPDPETGIGSWSYEAFARAMRHGIARDGSHLYPAFPYTAFAKMSESDMLALYAYIMSQPPVVHSPPKTNLPFPLNQRRLVAGWNWLFHDSRPFVPDVQRSAEWNRGKYLVDGMGHCGACHTPRNALGAEKGGFAYLSGGRAEGWDAPSLIAGHASPVPWTEGALFDYLRTGFSPEHGVAAGPMAPVVAGLATLPESDVRAIAHYLASLSPRVDPQQAAQTASERVVGADLGASLAFDSGRRIFDAACAVCHAESGGVGHFGVRPLMGLNTSVAQAEPDNLLRVLQDGIDQPATEHLGYMPGFKDVLDDRQIAELASYIRARFAPDQAAWQDLEATSARIRSQTH